ncbi:hypothetical protein PoB_000922800, partial [Plakobranchus ocellatus]
YRAKLSTNLEPNKISAMLLIQNVTRKMTRCRCYIDDKVLFGAECTIIVYAKGNELKCESAQFIDDNTAASFKCTMEKIYPKGRCSVTLLDGKPAIKDHVITSVSHEKSARFPDDMAVTCQLRIEVAGNEEGSYRFNVEVTPDVQGVPDKATVSLEVKLRLLATALFNPNENGHKYTIPSDGRLTIAIQVTGNPQPSRVSLSVKYDDNSAPIPLTSQDYSHTYSANAGSGRGVLNLIVTGGFRTGRATFYTLHASNGVIGSETFEYRFSVDATLAGESELNCEDPKFIEENAAATFKCTLKKTNVKGRCNMTILEGNSAIEYRAIKPVSHETSASSPSDTEVTCQFRIEVAGNEEGNYRFKVEATPDVQDVPAMATVSSEVALRLSATTLFNPLENGQVYNYPSDGQLKIFIQVIGNPEPNQFLLTVRYDETSTPVPLSSQDYSLTYMASTSSGRGVINLIVAGGLKEGRSSFYTLHVSNGIAGPVPFEHSFSVDASDGGAEEDKDDTTFGTVGLAVGGLGLLLIVVTVVIFGFLRKKENNSNIYDYPDETRDANTTYAEPGYLSPSDESSMSTFGPPLPHRVQQSSTQDSSTLNPYIYYTTPVDGCGTSTGSYPTVLDKNRAAGYLEPSGLTLAVQGTESTADAGQPMPPRAQEESLSALKNNIKKGFFLLDRLPVSNGLLHSHRSWARDNRSAQQPSSLLPITLSKQRWNGNPKQIKSIIIEGTEREDFRRGNNFYFMLIFLSQAGHSPQCQHGVTHPPSTRVGNELRNNDKIIKYRFNQSRTPSASRKLGGSPQPGDGSTSGFSQPHTRKLLSGLPQPRTLRTRV